MDELANTTIGSLIRLLVEGQSKGIGAGTDLELEGGNNTDFAEILKTYLGAGTAILTGGSAISETGLSIEKNLSVDINDNVLRIDQDVGDSPNISSDELDGKTGVQPVLTGLQEIPVTMVSGNDKSVLADTASHVSGKSTVFSVRDTKVGDLMPLTGVDAKTLSTESVPKGIEIPVGTGIIEENTGENKSTSANQKLYSIVKPENIDTKFLQENQKNGSTSLVTAEAKTNLEFISRPNSTLKGSDSSSHGTNLNVNSGASSGSASSPSVLLKQTIQGRYFQPDIRTVKLAGSIIEQIVHRLALFKLNDRSEIRIKLHPEVLGDLRIKVTVENGVLAAKLVTASHFVKEGIEAGLTQLRQNLSSQGFEVQNLSVSVSGDEHGSQRESSNGSAASQKGDRLTVLEDEDDIYDTADDEYTVNWLV